MLLLELKKHKVLLAVQLVLMSIYFCIADVAFSKERNSADFFKTFSNLTESASKENQHLLDSWNEYIIKVLGYSNAEHLNVIEQLTHDYAGSYNTLNEKYEKEREQDKIQYTSEWLNDLVARFGKDFVCNSRRAILLNLMIAFDRRNAKKYDQDAKEIISKELILYLAYERYLGVFIDYYNQLSEKDQKKMNAWKEVADKYLSIINSSHFAQIYYGRHMEKKIDDNVMKKENKELYMYFKNADIPFGGWVLSQARKDIDLFIKRCKMQSKTTRE
jgi:hypothetical protein